MTWSQATGEFGALGGTVSAVVQAAIEPEPIRIAWIAVAGVVATVVVIFIFRYGQVLARDSGTKSLKELVEFGWKVVTHDYERPYKDRNAEQIQAIHAVWREDFNLWMGRANTVIPRVLNEHQQRELERPDLSTVAGIPFPNRYTQAQTDEVFLLAARLQLLEKYISERLGV